MTTEMKSALFACLAAFWLTGCFDSPDTDTQYASASELDSFCDRLPRPGFAVLDKHAASNDWFEVYEIEPSIFAIHEPYQWQEVISWLIVGEETALLFDTGNGIGNIREVVDALTTKPVSVLNSHSHYDHVGGNHQFDEIITFGTDFSKDRAKGLKTDDLALEVSPDALCRKPPENVTPDTHEIHGYTLTATVADGDTIDLGGRKLEILHLPGHTDDALAIVDREAGFLWSGDSFYEGPIWLYAPETDLEAYGKSVARLADIAPSLNAVFPAHNTPRADPQLLVELETAFNRVMQGEVTGQQVGESQVEYPFEGFSILMRSDHVSGHE